MHLDRRLGLVLGFSIVVSGAGAEELVGRWHDYISSPDVKLRIVRDHGEYFRVIEGPSTRRRVRLERVKASGGRRTVFRRPGSSSATAYEIDPEGHLLVFGEDGFIRKAKKLR